MGTIKTTNIETITGSGTLTLGQSGETISIPSGVTMSVPSGGLSGQNYPAFFAYLSLSQGVSSAVYTKAQIDTKVFDTNNYYDNTTNYRFTPLVAGKYLVFYGVSLESGDGNATVLVNELRLNGSRIVNSPRLDTTTGITRFSAVGTQVVDMNGSTDYLEVFGYVSGFGTEFNAGDRQTIFGAYRIGS